MRSKISCPPFISCMRFCVILLVRVQWERDYTKNRCNFVVSTFQGGRGAEGYFLSCVLHIVLYSYPPRRHI
jgi:hypothetical protein